MVEFLGQIQLGILKPILAAEEAPAVPPMALVDSRAAHQFLVAAQEAQAAARPRPRLTTRAALAGNPARRLLTLLLLVRLRAWSTATMVAAHLLALQEQAVAEEVLTPRPQAMAATAASPAAVREAVGLQSPAARQAQAVQEGRAS